MKNKNGSVLIISLSILAILVIFALGLGQRAAMGLRISRYQRDSLKALSLADSGINRMIFEIMNDTTADYDSLKDSWVNNETVFKKIAFENDTSNFAKVGYLKQNSASYGEDFIYGAQDEESKICINRIDASGQDEIKEALILAGLPELDAEEIKKVIAEWINTAAETEPEKKIFKNEPLKQKQELLLILEFYYKNKGTDNYSLTALQTFNKIKYLFTVFGEGKININTASEDVLKIIGRAAAKAGAIDAGYADSLATQIIEFRDGANGPFTDQTAVDTFAPPKIEEKNIFDAIKSNFCLKSNFFMIEVSAQADQTYKNISSVYDKDKKVMVFWHQS